MRKLVILGMCMLIIVASVLGFYIYKAMTKKAELQSFQRGGVWCEPSAKQFKSYPFRAEAPKASERVDSFRRCSVKAQGLLEPDEWRIKRNLSGTAGKIILVSKQR